MNTLEITNYKPKDFAELLGVSVKTLQRWDRNGILKANRTPTNRRYYTYNQYLLFKNVDIIKVIHEIILKDVSDKEKVSQIKELIENAKEFQNRN